MKRGLLTLTGLAMLTILATSGINKHSSASGKVGYTTTGCNCHGNQTGTVSMTGIAAKVLPNTKYTFNLVYAPGASYKYFGLDVKASAGTLAAGTGEKISSKELTHSAPMGGTATTSYTFAAASWTSPATLGAITFNFAAVAGSSTGTTSGPYQIGSFTTTVAATTPVEFAAVNTKWLGENKVSIAWKTASETNANFFEVERSINGLSYTPIAKVSAAGTSTTINNYSINDVVTGTNLAYYRIKLTDNDGETSLSEVRAVNVKPAKSIIKSMYPNPTVAGQPVNIQYVAVENGKVNVELYNCLGKKMNSLTTDAVIGENDIKFNLGRFVSPGIYYVVVTNGIEKIAQMPISVQ